jgi:hypothetical protein
MKREKIGRTEQANLTYILFICLVVLIVFLFNFENVVERFSEEGIEEIFLSPETLSESSVNGIEYLTEDIKAVYGGPELNSQNIDLLQSKGVNTFLIKLKSDFHTNRVHNNIGDLPLKLKEYASLAKQKDFKFFPVLNFVHFVDDPNDLDRDGLTFSVISNNNVIYLDGSVGKQITVFDEIYWKHLSDIAVLLTQLNENPDYKVDGLFIDFELYKAEEYEEPRKFNGLWGFERTTFDKYIVDRGLDSPVLESPPEGKADTYYWLERENRVMDYYVFLKEEILRLSENMEFEVSVSNPNFLLGLYPTASVGIDYSNPGDGKWYLQQMLAGWSNPNDPAIMFSSTTFGSSNSLPLNKLRNGKMPEGYYRLDRIYQDPIWENDLSKAPYAYYLNGLDIRNYFNNLGHDLYYFLEESNGYWVYTSAVFEDFDWLSINNPNLILKCYDSVNNIFYKCLENEYPNAVGYYLEQMSSANVATEEIVLVGNAEVSCSDGASVSCVGDCGEGVRSCVNGLWDVCIENVQICDANIDSKIVQPIELKKQKFNNEKNYYENILDNLNFEKEYDAQDIMDAIDSANDGDVITLPRGRYIISDPISIVNRKITLQAEKIGDVIFVDNTIGTIPIPRPIFEIYNSMDSEKFILNNLIFLGQGKEVNHRGLRIVDSENVIIKDSIFSGFNFALEVVGHGRNIHILNNVFIRNGYWALSFRNSRTLVGEQPENRIENSIIESNLFYDNSQGIVLLCSNNIILKENLIVESDNVGVRIETSNSNNIYDNFIYNNGGNGLVPYHGSNNNLFKNNIIIDNNKRNFIAEDCWKVQQSLSDENYFRTINPYFHYPSFDMFDGYYMFKNYHCQLGDLQVEIRSACFENNFENNIIGKYDYLLRNNKDIKITYYKKFYQSIKSFLSRDNSFLNNYFINFEDDSIVDSGCDDIFSDNYWVDLTSGDISFNEEFNLDNKLCYEDNFCDNDGLCESENGETFIKCRQDCFCIEEGQKGSRQNYDVCCVGLFITEIPFPTPSGCTNDFEGEFYCTNCGDGECKQGEDVCNCQEDCSCIQTNNGIETCDGLDNDCDGNVDEGGDSLCDDELFCNGVETCSLGSCNVGTLVDVDDGVACTIDSCDEVNDAIVNVVNNNLCESWQSCNPVSGCRQVSCFDCENCDTWFTGCDYDKCHNDCDWGDGCYFVGDVVGDDCIHLIDACSGIAKCEDYSKEECVANLCDKAPSSNGCELIEDNCIAESYCGDSVCDVLSGENCDSCVADCGCSGNIDLKHCVSGDCVECVGVGDCDDSESCTNDLCTSNVCINTEIDNDNDGYSICSGVGFDCDDGDENVKPGVLEICDTKDNDCDSEIDEGCNCIDGNTQSCGSSDVGECSFGLQTCVKGGWGDCVGEVEVVVEKCDGLDNDCDGSVDEELTRATSCGVGECVGNTGIETCFVGVWESNTCDAFAGAVSDANCNGVDDDCDGPVDEDYVSVGTSCGVGECAGNTGVTSCVNSEIVDDCNELVGAVAESCEDATGFDGLDNNCDGVEDLDCDSICDKDGDGHTSSLFCAFSSKYVLGDCDDSNANVHDDMIESCNGVDDDCSSGSVDGSDEIWFGDGTSCGVGECSSVGIWECVSGLKKDSCDAGSPSVNDASCDGKDNDCSGVVDEDYVSLETSCGVGECLRGGLTSCVNGGVVNSCVAGDSVIETCDTKDNDCDSEIDEGCNCVNGRTQECGSSDVGECSKGLQTCVNGDWGDCVGNVGVVAESCDGKDNDCDGSVDEGGDGLCNDLIDCTDNVCNGLDKCSFVENHDFCNNDLFCDGQEICSIDDGNCISVNAPDCSDIFDCTDNSCDEVEDDCVSVENSDNCLVGQVCDIINFEGLGGCGYVENCEDNDEDGLYDYDENLCSNGKDVCAGTNKSYFIRNPFKLNEYLPKTEKFIIPTINKSNILNFENFSVEYNGTKIDFVENISLVRINSTGCFEVINLSKIISFKNGQLNVNTSLMSEFNKSALLRFSGVDFENPQVYRDNVNCSDCKIVNYSKGNFLDVRVTGFVSYEVVEGRDCGDGICNFGESCSSCSSDCGACSTGGSPTGGSTNEGSSSGGNSFENKNIIPHSNVNGAGVLEVSSCIEKWSCNDWSYCEDESQIRKCDDLNECGTENRKPDLEKKCLLSGDIFRRTSVAFFMAFLILNIVVISTILYFRIKVRRNKIDSLRISEPMNIDSNF